MATYAAWSAGMSVLCGLLRDATSSVSPSGCHLPLKGKADLSVTDFIGIQNPSVCAFFGT